MINKLQERINEAMKLKNQLLLDVLREMKSKINLAIKEGKTNFTEVFSSMAKIRKQAQLEFIKAGKYELALKEAKELGIIQQYLPKELSIDEIKIIINNIIKEKSIDSIKGMSIIMKEINLKYPGQDGKTISEIVRKTLNEK